LQTIAKVDTDQGPTVCCMTRGNKRPICSTDAENRRR
jgi:hypothetical protein